MTPKLENLLQHYQSRSGVYGPPVTISEEDMNAIFQKMLPALLEQSAHKFTFSPNAIGWIGELSKLIFAVLEQARAGRYEKNTEAMLMTVINALEAFAQAQSLIAREGACEDHG